MPIWDRWNALPPRSQLADSVAANERFIARLEHLEPDQQDAFALSLFGSEVDLAGLTALRVAEHVLHTWDIAVALDPAATVAPDAVELLHRHPPAARGGGRPARPRRASGAGRHRRPACAPTASPWTRR